MKNMTDSKKELYVKAYGALCGETLIGCEVFSLSDEKPPVAGSKVGGVPYVPKGGVLPLGGDGRQLRFLAQIDCSELKALADFPHKGLLQFFIGKDDAYGLFDEKGFAVLYHEEIDGGVTEEECRALTEVLSEDDISPLSGEFGMVFSENKMPMTLHDFRYDELARKKLKEVLSDSSEPAFLRKLFKNRSAKEIDEALFDEVFCDFEQDCNYCSHRLGGYPVFAQSDPREGDNEDKTVLLFQLDTDSDGGNERIMWGDCGVCNFFISPEDLKKRDFSKVLYNWDCY